MYAPAVMNALAILPYRTYITMRFDGQTVLITGGGRGIGRAIAHAFAEEGAHVAINYRFNSSAANETLNNLPGNGHIAIQCDISDPGAVKAMCDDVISQLGHLDILVNNAAIHEHHPIDTVDYRHWQDEWSKTLATNLIGAVNLSYCAAQYMIARKSGRILFVSSRGAFRGEPEQPAYGASKGAINSFGQSMARALAKYNIGVGLVAPGFVQTDMVAELLASPKGEEIRGQSPFNRVAKPEEVANAILYLADPKSIWSSGTIIDVNGASYFR